MRCSLHHTLCSLVGVNTEQISTTKICLTRAATIHSLFEFNKGLRIRSGEKHTFVENVVKVPLPFTPTFDVDSGML